MDRREILHGAATLAGWGLLGAGAWPRARAPGPARPRPRPAVRLGVAQDLRARPRDPALRGPGRPAAAAAGGADLGPVRGAALPPRPRAVGRHRPARSGSSSSISAATTRRRCGSSTSPTARRGRSSTTPACSTTARPRSTRRCRTIWASPAGACTSTPTSRRTSPSSSAPPTSAPPMPATSTASPAAGSPSTPALNRPEEFPRFSRFWLVRPRPTDTTMTAYALLESESITGAYRFGISPGGSHDDGGHGPAVPAQADRAAGHRAHDQHVLVRRERAARAATNGARRSTIRTGCPCGAATASGSGVR